MSNKIIKGVVGTNVMEHIVFRHPRYGQPAPKEEPKAQSNLPPDPEGLNQTRSDFAHVSVLAYMKESGCEGSVDGIQELAVALIHLAARSGFNTEEFIQKTAQSYTDQITP
jgi:hypothetical protein